MTNLLSFFLHLFCDIYQNFLVSSRFCVKGDARCYVVQSGVSTISLIPCDTVRIVYEIRELRFHGHSVSSCFEIVSSYLARETHLALIVNAERFPIGVNEIFLIIQNDTERRDDTTRTPFLNHVGSFENIERNSNFSKDRFAR